eukprot:sb/3474644/
MFYHIAQSVSCFTTTDDNANLEHKHFTTDHVSPLPMISEEAAPSSPVPRNVQDWLRETIHHGRIDSESNTTSVEDNLKSDGRYMIGGTCSVLYKCSLVTKSPLILHIGVTIPLAEKWQFSRPSHKKLSKTGLKLI